MNDDDELKNDLKYYDIDDEDEYPDEDDDLPDIDW